MKTWIPCLFAITSMPALAHEGHGLLGSHWHATDVLGFVGLAAVIALAIWASGGRK